MNHILGIDVGTTGTRALVLNGDGVLVASATADHPAFATNRDAWAEQDPADWWRACQEAIRAVLSAGNVSADQIACVGLAGQMHGTVLLDDAGEVLRPAILWCDQRGAEECLYLNERIGAARLLELTLNPALTNFTLIKLLWIRRNQPEVWNRIRHILLPKDYVRYCLSGAYAIDVAEASGTLMLDVANRRWSKELLHALGISADWLPGLFESPEICARVSPTAAKLTGLAEGTPIVAGAGDQAAGAVGMGVTRPGAVSSIIGTSGVVFAASDRPVPDPKGRLHTFCHAIPGRWHLMGVTQAAGLSMRWFRDRLLGAAGEWSYDRMTEEAALAPPGSDGVMWGPFLMGERTPHCDPEVRAGLVGLAAGHGRAHVLRAVMEGVAFSLRDSLTVFAELGVPVAAIRLGGGGARSKLWRQIQADVFGQAVETVQTDEGAALGAALLAGVGIGLWPDVDGACRAVVRTAERIPCRPGVAAFMDERYQQYQRVYPALRSLRHALCEPTYA